MKMPSSIETSKINPEPVEQNSYSIPNIQEDYYKSYIDARISSEPPPDITFDVVIEHSVIPGVILVTGSLYRVTLELIDGVWTETGRELAGSKTTQYISLTSGTYETRVEGLRLVFRAGDIVAVSPTCSFSDPERSLIFLQCRVKSRFTKRIDEFTKKQLIYIFWHSPACIIVESPRFPVLRARLI